MPRATWIGMAMIAAGCAGSGGAPEPEDARAAAGSEDASDAAARPSLPTPWAEMSHADREAWMMAEVQPRMGALFREYDADAYASTGCASCHGADAAQHGFHMPSNALPALPATGTPEQRQMVRQYPQMVRFMFQRVLPTMQALVGAPPYDEATGEGFSCYSCHPHAGDEGSTLVHLTGPAE